MKKIDLRRFDANMKTREVCAGGGVFWIDADDSRCRLDGFAFRSAGEPFRRLPYSPALPEAVNALAGHTAGGMLTFRTDSRRIRLRARLENHCRMDHMAATGSGGFDLYAGPAGHRRFSGIARFDPAAAEYEILLLEREQGGMEEFQLNFPLYSGIGSLAVGLDEGAVLETPAPWSNPAPVVIYGSSITQGGCASRPGSAFPALLSRMLDRPFLNFGFSGSGKGEPEVIAAIAAVRTPALFVLDYQANAGSAGIRDTLAGAIDTLRETHPSVPVLIVSRIRWNRERLVTGSDFLHDAEAEEAIAYQRTEAERRRAAGDRLVFFLNGESLTGPDWHECTVDGVHPTDLGFHRMAEGLLPVISELLTLTGTHHE